ncbi:MAG: prenyltransferase [Kiritimatiellia bacterium]|nr:prenyltransferase [Lentisphaerota bacterium]
MILRIYAFPVVIAPTLAGAVVAGAGAHPTRWGLILWIWPALLCLHAGVNLINDYYDFIKGVDRAGAPSTWALTEQMLTPRQALRLAYVLLAVGPMIALPALLARGPALWLMGLAGLAGGYWYTAPPLGLKYRGCGEVTVFLLTGPLLTAATVLTLNGMLSGQAWLIGVPMGCLSTAILYGNNLRDRGRDRAAGFRTLAHHLGRRAHWGYPLLVLAAGLSLLPIRWAGLVDNRGLMLAVLGLSGFFIPLYTVLHHEAHNWHNIDQRTARSYLLFSACFITALLI